MNIHNIEAFVYVVQFGSFNKAAEALYLSQPSISARIKSLENDISRKLLFRDRNNCMLTEDGKNFLPYAEKILHEYHESMYKLNQQLYIPNQVKIACSNSISSYIISDFLFQLRKEYPDCQFKILSNHSEAALSRLLKNEVDCAIIREINHPRTDSTVIKYFDVGLYTHIDHPLAQIENKLTIEELADNNIIFYDHNSPEWLGITRLLSAVNFQEHLIIDVDNMEAAKRLVMKGAGICFLPEYAVEEEIQHSMLARISIDHLIKFKTSVSFVHLKEENISPIVTNIKESLMGYYP